MEEDEAIVQASKLTLGEQALGVWQDGREPWSSHPAKDRITKVVLTYLEVLLFS